MLVLAFASEIIDTVRPGTLRSHLESRFNDSIAVRDLPVIFEAPLAVPSPQAGRVAP